MHVFTGIDGAMGVDNNFYRVTGCIKNFRAKPRSSFRFSIINESMRNGSFQTVVVMSGEGDPMNDNDVTVGMYATKDRMVKDTSSGAVPPVADATNDAVGGPVVGGAPWHEPVPASSMVAR